MDYLKEIILKNKILVCIYMVLGIVLAFLNNFSAHYYQKLIDRFTGGTLTIGSIVIYGTVLLALCILNYLDEYPGRKLEHTIFLDLKIKALSKMSSINYQDYQGLGTGQLVQRIENGASTGKNILFDYYFCLGRELIPSIIFSGIFIYQISRPIMGVILVGYGIVFMVTHVLLKALYQIKERILINEEKMNHYLVRGFMELVVFRMNKRFPYEIEKATKAKEEIVDSKVKMTLIHEAFFTVFAVLVTFIKIGIIAYGWLTQSITIGAVVALITLVDHAYTPIAIFNILFVQYKLDKTAFKRYENFLYATDDIQLEEGSDIKKLDGSITLENLSFGYANRKIFENLNLCIQKGEKLALVGESGSGKSTLIKLLIGLLKPSKGTIWIDGYNLSEVNLKSYYSHISYISQESPIFDGTLRENLVFDKNIEDRVLIEALERADLSKLYSKLKDGLDTEIGERGILLSGGERQRLALARLWFEDSKIVILDEATSAMDNMTEEAVMGALMEQLQDKTVIVIAHRLNSVENFERIIAFRAGKIVGQGSFESLIRDNAYFKKLYNTSPQEQGLIEKER